MPKQEICFSLLRKWKILTHYLHIIHWIWTCSKRKVNETDDQVSSNYCYPRSELHVLSTY